MLAICTASAADATTPSMPATATDALPAAGPREHGRGRRDRLRPAPPRRSGRPRAAARAESWPCSAPRSSAMTAIGTRTPARNGERRGRSRQQIGADRHVRGCAASSVAVAGGAEATTCSSTHPKATWPVAAAGAFARQRHASPDRPMRLRRPPSRRRRAALESRMWAGPSRRRLRQRARDIERRDCGFRCTAEHVAATERTAPGSAIPLRRRARTSRRRGGVVQCHPPKVPPPAGAIIIGSTRESGVPG